MTVILDGIRVGGALAGWLELSESTAVAAPAGAARFYVLLRGRCWFQLGTDAPLALGAGDWLLVPHGDAHALFNDPNVARLPIEQTLVPVDATQDDFADSNAGTRITRLACGLVNLHQEEMGAFLSALPPVIHVPGEQGQVSPWLLDSLRFMMHESDLNLPGAAAVIDRLVQIVFIQAVRMYQSTLTHEHGNWLAALADPDIGNALGLMHSRPNESWTVASLAEQVEMSRSVFAARFNAAVGQPPLHYLLHCRMEKAANLLRQTKIGVKEIANQVGYESESAFSNAFKRWAGKAPGSYRRSGKQNDSAE